MAVAIQPGTGIFTPYKKKGKTADIINAIAQADTTAVQYVTAFAPQMAGNDIVTTCQNIYNFVHSNIPYVEDPDGVQFVQMPGMLYNNRRTELGGTGDGGDCKSMALFCGSVLKALGHQFKYRFTSASKNSDYHHVYCIVKVGNEYLPLDCTLDTFGVEAPFAKHYDMQPARSASIAGAKVGQSDEQYWSNQVAEMKAQYTNKKTLALARAIVDIKEHYKTQLVRRNKALELVQKNWQQFLLFASATIYNFWNDKNYSAYNRCRLNGQGADIAFPAHLENKRLTSVYLYQMLRQIGLTFDTIKALAELAIYNQHGVTLDYFLYRIYCSHLYGQPFKPKPNLPYYDGDKNMLVPNGSSDINQLLSILLCLPAQGGIGRTFETPYWARGGFLVNNGVTDTFPNNRVVVGYDDKGYAVKVTLDKWLQDNPAPGTIRPDGTTVPGFHPQGGQLSDQAISNAMQVYNAWRSGELVTLPTPTNVLTAVKIGDGAAVIAIVTAVVSAVVAILGAIMAIIEQFKETPDKSAMPFPVQDFQMVYTTTDGCTMFKCVNEQTQCGGVGYRKICPDGTIIDNPDLTKAENQPPAAGFGEPWTEEKKNNLLLVGGGLLLAGGVLMLNQKPNKV